MSDRHRTGGQHGTGDVLERLLSATTDGLQKYWRPAALALAIVIVSFLAYVNYTGRRRAELEQTWAALSQMPPMLPGQVPDEELRTVADECRRLLAGRRTAATPWVLLKLGNVHMELGEAEAAAGAYGRIKEAYPDHYVYLPALRNLGAALELEGEYRRAAAAYEIVAEQASGAAFRWIDAGRNWELAGEREAAIAAYERAKEQAAGARIENHYRDLAAFRLATLQRDGEPLTPLPPPVVHLPEVEGPRADVIPSMPPFIELPDPRQTAPPPEAPAPE